MRRREKGEEIFDIIDLIKYIIFVIVVKILYPYKFIFLESEKELTREYNIILYRVEERI